MKKSRLFALLLALAMVVSLFAGCGGDTETPATDTQTPAPDTQTPATDTPAPVEPVKAEKIYRTYLENDTAMLNAHDDVNTQVETPLFWTGAKLWRDIPGEDGLSHYHVGDLATDLPVLVETVADFPYTKWVSEVQADGTSQYVPAEATGTKTVWEWTIRDDATWANGEKITAEDVIYSWKMLLDPVMLNKMGSLLYDQASVKMLNGMAYYLGKCDWEDVGLKILEDGKTIQFTGIGTCNVEAFCTQWDQRTTYIVNKDLYEAGMNDKRDATTYGADLASYMGCGPYFLDSWEQGNKHIYKKNPDHWLADLFHYDVVEVYIIEEQNAAVQMFEAGKLDQLTPDTDTIQTYLEDPRMVSYSSNRMYHIDVNDGSTPTRNPVADTNAWRKAVYHSLDRETIAKEFFGHMEPAGWFISTQAGILSEGARTFRDSEWGDKIEQMVADWSAEGHTTGYNPELARKYLADAYAEKGLAPDTVIEVGWLYSSGDGAEWEAVGQWLALQYEEIFEGKVKMYLTAYPGEMSTPAAKAEFEWDLNNNSWSRNASRDYPYQAFYYFRAAYATHPNVYISERFDTQWDFCDSIKEEPWETQMEAAYELEKIYLEDVVNVPVVQNVAYTLFSERLEVPMQTYIPGFGWGTNYGDIVE